MDKPQNASADPVSIRVTASSDNENDEGYQHCFEQNPKATLTFEVYIKPPVDSIQFVLWRMHDPSKPRLAEPPRDYSGKSGHVTIMIGPDTNLDLDLHPHLGPGPYCVTLTASSADSKDARKIVGNAIYYYDTWKESPPFEW